MQFVSTCGHNTIVSKWIYLQALVICQQQKIPHIICRSQALTDKQESHSHVVLLNQISKESYAYSNKMLDIL
jgi:hypothetical protein